MVMAGMDGGAGAPGAGALARLDVGGGPGAAATAGMQARAKRDYVRRAYAQKVAMVQRACRRIEAGWSLTEVCREPDMPGRSTVVSWLTRHPELRAMVEAAEAAAAEVFLPRRDYHYWDPEIAAEVLARIEDGKGLREVCAERDMPVACTVTRWLNERPEFAAAYRRAREAQADRLFDLAWRIACEATEDEVATARLKIQTLKWRVGKLAPRVYGPLKAQDPPGGGEGGGKGGEPTIVAWHIRSWAKTPDNKLVETTWATVGMTPGERQALCDDVRAGRISVEEVERMNAAAEAEDAARRAERLS